MCLGRWQLVSDLLKTDLAVVIGICMRIIGPIFVCGFYYLMGYHTWIFLTVISPVMRKRVGVEFGMVWTLIGVIITYNVVWNHLLAMFLKPGSPKDLIVSSLYLTSCCVFRISNGCESKTNSEKTWRSLRIVSVGIVVKLKAWKMGVLTAYQNKWNAFSNIGTKQ